MQGQTIILRSDGSEEVIDRVLSIQETKETIGAPEGVDTVNLRDGHVMLVGDRSALENRPVNPEATRIYLGLCVPGTTWKIHGDVAIVWDADYAAPPKQRRI